MKIGAEEQLIEIAHMVRCLSISLALKEIAVKEYLQEFGRLTDRYERLKLATNRSAFGILEEDVFPSTGDYLAHEDNVEMARRCVSDLQRPHAGQYDPAWY